MRSDLASVWGGGPTTVAASRIGLLGKSEKAKSGYFLHSPAGKRFQLYFEDMRKPCSLSMHSELPFASVMSISLWVFSSSRL